MKKILVVDDNQEVNENICEILELAGYKVYPALNGKTGVQQALKILPDLILCDIMMPELDGFGVLKVLSRREETFNIPFIFLTAKVEHEDLRKGMTLGADDYITKPFDDAQLLEAIDIRIRKSEQANLTSSQKENHLYSQDEAVKAMSELIQDKGTLGYPLGENLFVQGKYPASVFYLSSGYVKAECTDDHDKTLILDILGPGDVLGFSAILLGQKYSYTARAYTDCEIIQLPIVEFRFLLENNHHYLKFLLNKLMIKHINNKRRMMNLAYSSVRERVAEAIIYLSGLAANKNGRIKSNHIREDLTQLAGVAKETLIRTLSDFKKEGLITLERNELVVLDIDRLGQI